MDDYKIANHIELSNGAQKAVFVCYTSTRTYKYSIFKLPNENSWRYESDGEIVGPNFAAYIQKHFHSDAAKALRKLNERF